MSYQLLRCSMIRRAQLGLLPTTASHKYSLSAPGSRLWWKMPKTKSYHLESLSESSGTRPVSHQFEGMDNNTSLTEWLKLNGANLSGAKIHDSQISGVGLVAMEDLDAGDVAFSIPMRSAIMVYPFDHEYSLGIDAATLPDTAIRLALKLLRERAEGASSPWSPYVNSLPSKLTDPVEMARGLDAPHMGSKTFPEILSVYKRTLECVMSFGQTLDDARWALSVVQSRAFGNGMGQELLVPYLDFMNHGDMMDDSVFSENHQANVTYGWQKSGDTNTPEDWKIVVKANRAINEGDELLVSYGDHQNEYFFLYYGFTPLFNCRDDLVLFDGLEAAVKWYCSTYPHRVSGLSEEERSKLIAAVKEEGDIGEVIKLNICSDGTVSPIMLNFFTMIFDEQEEQAEVALARACYGHLHGLPSYLDDLQQLSDAHGGELNLFEYLSAIYKEPITDFARNIELPSALVNGQDSRPVLEKGSPQFWFVVHEAMKKQIAWDYILDVEPTKEELGLQS